MSPLPQIQNGSTEPLYNIGVVSRMTGVSMATLRAWERRYNFPESGRTEGGHRLYSEQDVLRLRWVKDRIDEGMQTSHAIQALTYQEKQRLGSRPAGPVHEAAGSEAYHPLEVHRQRVIESLLRQDLAEAEVALGEALAASNPEDLILEVISPAIAAVGQAWEERRISIAAEHLATNYLRHRILMWMMSCPPPRSLPPIMLACAPNEWHEGGLLALAALLRRRRWPVIYLGQALPLPEIASLARQMQPDLVVVVATTPEAAADLVDWPHWLPEAAHGGRPQFSFGGRAYIVQPELRLRTAGIYLGDTIRQGIETIESLLVN